MDGANDAPLHRRPGHGLRADRRAACCGRAPTAAAVTELRQTLLTANPGLDLDRLAPGTVIDRAPPPDSGPRPATGRSVRPSARGRRLQGELKEQLALIAQVAEAGLANAARERDETMEALQPAGRVGPLRAEPGAGPGAEGDAADHGRRPRRRPSGPGRSPQGHRPVERRGSAPWTASHPSGRARSAHQGDELVERRAPALVEAHLAVALGSRRWSACMATAR